MVLTREVTVEHCETELVEGNKRLSIFLEISYLLSTSRNLEELMDGAICRVLDHFPFQAGIVYLMDEAGQFLRLGAAKGMQADGLERVKLDEDFSGKAARTRSLIAQYVSDSDDGRRAQLLTAQGLEFIVCVPLTLADKVMGVMNLAAEKAVSLDQGTVEFLSAVGRQIAIALNQANRLQEMTRKAEDIKFFAYCVAHDLKSPATSIKGFASRLDSLYRETLDARGKGYCDRILKASDQVLRLVDDLNAYIRFGEAPLHVEKFHLGELLEDIEKEFGEILRTRKVSLVAPQVSPQIVGDRLSIARAVRNMVDNALKYGGNDLSTIQIAY
jgi:signal transduction histidine kinase